MCRAVEEGGRRCNHNGTPYGVAVRNLSARKQYHERKLATGGLSKAQQEKTQKLLAASTAALDTWKNERKEFGAGKDHLMELTPATEKVLAQLEDSGFHPYIVGGSVRDTLMGMDSKDIDIEVYGGTPNEIAKSLRKLGQVDEVGKAFGVLKIRIGKEDFDVSLPRKDSKVGDGHRGFDISIDPDLTMEEATERRDFTINALMYSHKHGYIIDKHGGLEDMEQKKLRHVSEAFDEDPLRVLRGVQMSSRFGMDLHPDTVEKAKSLKGEFKDLATERVQGEFEKLYTKGKSSHKALKLLQQTEWDENFTGLKEANTKKLRKQVKRMQKLIRREETAKDRKDVFLASSIAAGIPDEKKRMKFLAETCISSRVKNDAYMLTQVRPPEKISSESLKHMAFDNPRGVSIRDWSIFESATGDKKYAKKVLRKAEKAGVADAREPEVFTGEDILALDPSRRPAGWVKKTIESGRAAQYAGKFDNHADAVKWLKSNGIVD